MACPSANLLSMSAFVLLLRPLAACAESLLRRARVQSAWRRTAFVLAVAASLAITAADATAQAPVNKREPPDILVLNSYAPGYRWSDDELGGFLGVLRKHKQLSEVEPVIEHLDFKRFTDPRREAWLLADVLDKCHTRPPRLIVTFDNPAFDFALKYRAQLGRDIPIVFGGVNRFTPDMIAGQHKITGVAEESDYHGTFELIARLQPATRHILVISSQTESSLESRKVFESIMPRYADRYQFEFFDRWTDAELIDRVAHLPDGWVGIILDVTRDIQGHHNYNDSAFSALMSKSARVPIFLTSRPPGDADWSVSPWDGIGGGMVVADVHGAKVGELAVRILNGEDADSIPVIRHSPQRLEVDHRQMARFGLSESLLPAGTQILNAPVTFYQVHRSQIVLTAVIVVVLCGIIVALSLNILWRRRAEQALRRAKEQIQSSQKLEAIGLLAGGVAHDFNNILQVIAAHGMFIRETPGLSDTVLEDLKGITDAGDRAARLTRQLLAFSQKQALCREPIDPNALVTELATMLRRLLGEHVELAVVPSAEPCTCIADRGQLEQVIVNLCTNARDAMPTGGRIRIELRRRMVETRDASTYPELKPGPHLAIMVADNGSGMSRDVLGRIFDPFFTTKPRGKGTGLGLAVVYGIVRQHDGAIRVTSEVGRGTEFEILLPLGTATPVVVPDAVRSKVPRGAGAILLAEDDPQVRAVGARILEANGFRVLTAPDGEEAERVIARHADDIRLAVLDVLMPKRNGRQVYDSLRARHPHIRVLFCSGYSAEMLPPEIAPEAGVALIHKPYSPEQLLQQVHRLLKPQYGRNAAPDPNAATG